MIDDMLNKVVCGDCLEVMKQLPDESIDCVITDPPYGAGLKIFLIKACLSFRKFI